MTTFIASWRINPEAKPLLKRIAECTSAADCVDDILDLVEHYDCSQVSRPERYNPKTGEPIGEKWVRGKEFAHPGFSRIEMADSNADDVIKVRRTVWQQLKERSYLYRDKVYVFPEHIESREASATGEYGGIYTTHYLKPTIVKPLQSKQER